MSPEKDSVTKCSSAKATRPNNPAEATGGEERSPEQIRAEIEETREEMGDTVAAVAAKTDVKAQAKAKVEDTKAQAKAKVDGVKDQAQEKAEEAKAMAKELGDQAKQAAPESMREGLQQARAFAKENSKPVAVAGGLLALFLLWRILKS